MKLAKKNPKIFDDKNRGLFWRSKHDFIHFTFGFDYFVQFAYRIEINSVILLLEISIYYIFAIF